MSSFDTNWYVAHMAKQAAKARPGKPPEDAEQRESDLHDKIIEECRRRGWLVVHSRMDMPTTTAKGVADFIIFADRSRVFLFEAKSKTGKLKPEQIGFAMMAEKLGHTVHVVRGYSEFLQIINSNEIHPFIP